MNEELYLFTLKNTLNEIKNINPGIKTSFIFRKNGQLIIGDEHTPNKVVVRAVDCINDIFKKTEAIGGLENLSIRGIENSLIVSSFNDISLAYVVSKQNDLNYINTVNRVLMQTIIKLLDKIESVPIIKGKSKFDIDGVNSVPIEVEKHLQIPKEDESKITLKKETTLNFSSIQLTVENLGGIFAPSDTVRIDSEILEQWENRVLEDLDL